MPRTLAVYEFYLWELWFLRFWPWLLNFSYENICTDDKNIYHNYWPVVVTVAVTQTDEDEQEDEEEEEAAGHPVHDGGGDGDGHRVHHHWARSHPHCASYR